MAPLALPPAGEAWRGTFAAAGLAKDHEAALPIVNLTNI